MHLLPQQFYQWYGSRKVTGNEDGVDFNADPNLKRGKVPYQMSAGG